ncbi:hypothetical protein ACRRTK_012163 [Alexandromys fortis]
MSLAPGRTQSSEEDPDDEKVNKVITEERISLQEGGSGALPMSDHGAPDCIVQAFVGTQEEGEENEEEGDLPGSADVSRPLSQLNQVLRRRGSITVLTNSTPSSPAGQLCRAQPQGDAQLRHSGARELTEPAVWRGGGLAGGSPGSSPGVAEQEAGRARRGGARGVRAGAGPGAGGMRGSGRAAPAHSRGPGARRGAEKPVYTDCTPPGE